MHSNWKSAVNRLKPMKIQFMIRGLLEGFCAASEFQDHKLVSAATQALRNSNVSLPHVLHNALKAMK